MKKLQFKFLRASFVFLILACPFSSIAMQERYFDEDPKEIKCKLSAFLGLNFHLWLGELSKWYTPYSSFSEKVIDNPFNNLVLKVIKLLENGDCFGVQYIMCDVKDNNGVAGAIIDQFFNEFGILKKYEETSQWVNLPQNVKSRLIEDRRLASIINQYLIREEKIPNELILDRDSVDLFVSNNNLDFSCGYILKNKREKECLIQSLTLEDLFNLHFIKILLSSPNADRTSGELSDKQRKVAEHLVFAFAANRILFESVDQVQSISEFVCNEIVPFIDPVLINDLFDFSQCSDLLESTSLISSVNIAKSGLIKRFFNKDAILKRIFDLQLIMHPKSDFLTFICILMGTIVPDGFSKVDDEMKDSFRNWLPRSQFKGDFGVRFEKVREKICNLLLDSNRNFRMVNEDDKYQVFKIIMRLFEDVAMGQFG